MGVSHKLTGTSDQSLHDKVMALLVDQDRNERIFGLSMNEQAYRLLLNIDMTNTGRQIRESYQCKSSNITSLDFTRQKTITFNLGFYGFVKSGVEGMGTCKATFWT